VLVGGTSLCLVDHAAVVAASLGGGAEHLVFAALSAAVLGAEWEAVGILTAAVEWPLDVGSVTGPFWNTLFIKLEAVHRAKLVVKEINVVRKLESELLVALSPGSVAVYAYPIDFTIDFSVKLYIFT